MELQTRASDHIANTPEQLPVLGASVFQESNDNSIAKLARAGKSNATDSLPECKIDDSEAKALKSIASGLASVIFEKASQSSVVDGVPLDLWSSSFVSSDKGDRFLNGNAKIKVETKGVPKPIELGSSPVTIRPSMGESAFASLVLAPTVEKAFLKFQSCGNQKPDDAIEIKLALPNHEELTGKMSVDFTAIVVGGPHKGHK